MCELIIGLGSNLGDRRSNILSAVGLVSSRIGPVRAVSELVETEPWGFESENPFLNGVVVMDDLPDPTVTAEVRLHAIIEILQDIEAGFGRVRTGVYTDRTIDLDILFYGDLVYSDERVTVPHPRLHERAFILVSLLEVCPDKIHPLLGKSIRQIASEIR